MRRSSPIAPVVARAVDDASPPFGPQPYFLLIDERFRVPIFVFVELAPVLPARAVTIEFASVGPNPRQCWAGVRPAAAIARDPEHWDRFKEFPSDGHARSVGFLPIEPRYVGPSWESYLGAFRPEGDRPPKRPAGAGVHG